MRNRTKSSAKLKAAHKEIRRLKEVIKNLQKERIDISIPLEDMCYLIPYDYFVTVDDLYDYLEKWGVLDSDERINSRYVEYGYFIIKAYSRNSDYGVMNCARILVTDKGQKWILNKLNEEKGEQKPSMSFTETVINSNDNIMLSVMSQILCSEGFDMDYDKFCDYLYDNNILSKDDIPYQKYIDKGYFIVKKGFINTAYGIKPSEIILITQKGQLWLINKIKEEIGE